MPPRSDARQRQGVLLVALCLLGIFLVSYVLDNGVATAAVTAQLRQSTGSFVQPFGILTLMGLLSCVHCWFVFSPGGPRGLS